VTEALGSKVVLFDGVCNVCNGAVNFIIDRDPEGRFQFASLQSPVGRALVAKYGVTTGPSSMVFIEDGVAFTESTAVARVARHLRGPAKLASAFGLFPRAFRDGVYRYFAAHRYAWFGQSESCRVPTPDIRRRFLSDSPG
jgi:predicted DCC family thiol-disulfide oxidoreductase YuxK